jgi:hypothetical protein
MKEQHPARQPEVVSLTDYFLAEEQQAGLEERLTPEELERHNRNVAAYWAHHAQVMQKAYAMRAVQRCAERRPPALSTHQPSAAMCRPREHRSGHGTLRRGPPSDDADRDPPASPFQAAWRVALHLTATELDGLVSHARILAAILRAKRWAA